MASIFSFILVMTVSPLASATMTLTGYTGYSNIDMTNPALPIIYGGFVGTCTAGQMDGANACNSCANATGFTPCSFSSVYENLNLILTFQSTQAFNLATITVEDSGGGTYSLPAVTPTSYSANASIPVTIPWSAICSSGTNSTACTGGTDGTVVNLTLTVTITSTAATTGTTTTTTTATTDTMQLNLVFRYVNDQLGTSNQYYTPPATGTFCSDQLIDSTGGDGMCGFTLFPGDEKAYVTNVSYAAGYPTVSGGTTYSGVVFFYMPASEGDESTNYNPANDVATLGTITSASAHTVISIDNTQVPPVLGDDRIQGLNNNARYCFAMGNQDLTTIISNMTPLPGTQSPAAATAITTSNAYDFCAEPSKVVGLLDDKHCFIATAAWGTTMAPQVQSFREFRNQYMLPFAWGRELIKDYYLYGPRYAHIIAANDTLRMAARTALWPPLIFAKVAVKLGLFPAFLLLLAFAGLLWESGRLLMRKKSSGEL